MQTNLGESHFVDEVRVRDPARATLSSKARLLAWTLGAFEVLALALLVAWICMQPRVFALYYPKLKSNEALPDALHIAQWLNGNSPLEKLSGGLLHGSLIPKEIVHFNDVRVWFKRLSVAAPAAGLALVAAIIGLRKQRRLLAAAQIRALLAILLLGVFAVCFALWDWRVFFGWLHKPFFEGTSWRLPRSSYSLQLFPNAFWRAMGLIVVLLPTVVITCIWAVVRKQPDAPIRDVSSNESSA